MIFPRRQRASGLANTVELAPLIDVVLLLLIFFMVSTTFLRREALTVTLPSAASGRAAAPVEAVEVQVSASGEYLVDGQLLSSAALLPALAERAQAGRPLRLAADRDARHQAVVRALDAAASAGFADVRLATRRPRGANHAD